MLLYPSTFFPPLLSHYVNSCWHFPFVGSNDLFIHLFTFSLFSLAPFVFVVILFFNFWIRLFSLLALLLFVSLFSFTTFCEVGANIFHFFYSCTMLKKKLALLLSTFKLQYFLFLYFLFINNWNMGLFFFFGISKCFLVKEDVIIVTLIFVN